MSDRKPSSKLRWIFHANIKFRLMYIFIIFASLTCAKYSSQTFAIHEHTYARSHTHQRISGAARHKYMLAFHSCGFSFTGICACMKRFLSESPLSYRRGKVSRLHSPGLHSLFNPFLSRPMVGHSAASRFRHIGSSLH